MLELLITILLAFGMSTESIDGHYKVNQEVVQKVEASPDFEKLGGDPALNAIVVTEDADPK